MPDHGGQALFEITRRATLRDLAPGTTGDSPMDSTPDTVRGDTAAAVPGTDPPVVRWPEPSPLADWWVEVMRHRPTSAA